MSGIFSSFTNSSSAKSKSPAPRRSSHDLETNRNNKPPPENRRNSEDLEKQRVANAASFSKKIAGVNMSVINGSKIPEKKLREAPSKSDGSSPTVFKMNGHVLKPHQLAVYQEAFNMFDKDGKGTINATKLGTVMRKLGINPTDAELADMINEVDINGNGTIEFFEFLDMLSHHVLNDPYGEIKAAFQLFDKDGNGYIDRNELKAGLKSIGEELSDKDLDLIWKHVDENKDGWISFEEFLRMMTL